MTTPSYAIPKNRASRLDEDCWVILIEAARSKGVSPRAALEGMVRTCSGLWVNGGCPQPALAIAPPTALPPTAEIPTDAAAAIDSLLD